MQNKQYNLCQISDTLKPVCTQFNEDVQFKIT